MSNRTYNQLWGKAQSEIQTVLHNESQVVIGKSQKDQDLAFDVISKVRNIVIFGRWIFRLFIDTHAMIVSSFTCNM